MSQGPDLERVLADWSPHDATSTDVIAADRLAMLSELLDEPGPAPADGDVLPLLWHSLSFLEWPPYAGLGGDGHPLEGPFMPPLPQRTRMFGGGRVRVHGPLRVGRAATKRSSLAAATVKTGRSGQLVFVTVRSEIEQDGVLRVSEEQDFVYRSGSRPAVAHRPPNRVQVTAGAPWQQAFIADSVKLFRMSALTANSHRIHYDEPYTRGVEQFPALVVHGPLLALVMARLAERHSGGRTIETFDYRLLTPAFGDEPLLCVGTPDDDRGRSASLAVHVTTDTPAAVATVVYRA
jgi:3-methylfumaryl-CoA hydratase